MEGEGEGEADKRIQKLRRMVKERDEKIEQLQEDNKTLRIKCREHFNAAQNLMRYQLQIPDTLENAQATKIIRGQVKGGPSFTIGPE